MINYTERKQISFDECYQIIMSTTQLLKEEKVSLFEATGRVLSQDIISDIDIPPFDKSAMDGFACRKEDIENPLSIIETIPAGYIPQKTIKQNQCSKIMTGGRVPKGADCVIMIENTKVVANIMTIQKQSSKNHIACKGQDVKINDLVLSKGKIITSAHIAILASVGISEVPVIRQPIVGIISTGNELVEPDKIPNPVQIRNSNGYQIMSQVQKTGAIGLYLGIADDTVESTIELIKQNQEKCDIILLSGGVSAGDYDYVPEALEALNFQTYFQKVAIKPGRPTTFARNEHAWAFGLPGNPVSSFILFHVLVHPFLLTLQGCQYKPTTVKATLNTSISRKNTSRLEHRPAFLHNDGTVTPIDYHGSAHIHAYAEANVFITIEQNIKNIDQGTLINVTLL